MSLKPAVKNAPEKTDEEQILQPCKTCGRTFAEDVLLRHVPICRKFSKRKCVQFNSFKQRAESYGPVTKKVTGVSKQSGRKYSWRDQHEEFITAIRSAKQATTAMREGRPLPPPPPPSINADYIQCPYCMRRFNETAAERHIVFCKDLAARHAFSNPSKYSATRQSLATQRNPQAPVAQRKEMSSALDTNVAGHGSRTQPTSNLCKTRTVCI
ncbi:zinc finger C2HC domain-containing protein 1B [Ascaphus truei]|uniref:zinc finger C2HC domain-containing protein 1B n=1 Tax=Ascaphus truei TaxID=8439 RepID=UPI003F59CA64